MCFFRVHYMKLKIYLGSTRVCAFVEFSWSVGAGSYLVAHVFLFLILSSFFLSVAVYNENNKMPILLF